MDSRKNKICKIIIIDDDPINNFICREVIKMVTDKNEILDFTSPETGLKYIFENQKNFAENEEIILFLDLNMPTMTGWEVLEELKKIEENTRNSFNIYVLSSSVDEKDKDRAKEEPNVKELLVKPLNLNVIKAILNCNHKLIVD